MWQQQVFAKQNLAPQLCHRLTSLSTQLNFRWTIPLTLIQLGEVKVDLANFDVKFRTKFLYVRFF
jgi:hypothetical protein